jgi:transcriptional regulator with XRE-family HTH domain
MSQVNIKFGKQLKSYREDRKLNQVEFGKILSYSQAELSKIENGKIDITINQYLQIIRTLEIYGYLSYLSLITKLKIEFLLVFKHEII